MLFLLYSVNICSPQKVVLGLSLVKLAWIQAWQKLQTKIWHFSKHPITIRMCGKLLIWNEKDSKTFRKTYYIYDLWYFWMNTHFQSLFRICLVQLYALLSENNLQRNNDWTKNFSLKISFQVLLQIHFFGIYGLDCKLWGDYREEE